jgi:hypothetical protein
VAEALVVAAAAVVVEVVGAGDAEPRLMTSLIPGE